MKEIVLTLVFIILVPIAISAVIATYLVCRVAISYTVECLRKVYRYASGKFKDNE